MPLHMRLQADGRGLQDSSTINERHASFADALYTAERQSRKETEERAKIQQALKMAQAIEREKQIRQMALEARKEKEHLVS